MPRWIQIILTSRWIAFVVFFASLPALTFAISWLERPDLAKGERPVKYNRIPILAWIDGEATETDTDGLDAFEAAHPDARLMPPAESGVIHREAGATTTWKLLERRHDEALVDLRLDDDDTILYVRYRVAGKQATPTYVRLNAFDYMFGAVPYAFGVALVTGVLRRRLKKRLDANSGP